MNEDSIRGGIELIRRAFLDIRVEVLDLITEAGRVAAFLRISGTNTGDDRRGAATGRHGSMRAFFIWRIAGGRLAESWASPTASASCRSLASFRRTMTSARGGRRVSNRIDRRRQALCAADWASRSCALSHISHDAIRPIVLRRTRCVRKVRYGTGRRSEGLHRPQRHSEHQDQNPIADIRTKAAVRLLLELLADPKYRYFANESYYGKGPIRRSVESYMRNKTLPPAFDPKQTNLDTEEVARRVLVRRYQPVLDFIRANPRYILGIGSLDGSNARDAVLAQNFFGEFMARDLGPGDAGALLLGANHATATSDDEKVTVHMRVKKAGFNCVSIRVLTDFHPGGDEAPDDAVLEAGKEQDQQQMSDVIRLTSLVDKTPVTIATDLTRTSNRASPFWRLTLGSSKVPVPAQFDYIVLQKA